MTKETTTTWTCDRCKKAVVSERQPAGQRDPWGTLMINQPSGFDFQGVPWFHRMQKRLLLCGECLDDVAATVNQREYEFIDIVFDGPPSHESGRFVEVEDSTGASISINVGEWIQDGDLWRLRIMRAPIADLESALGEISEIVWARGWTCPDDVVGRVRQKREQARQSARMNGKTIDALESRITEAIAVLGLMRHHRTDADTWDRPIPSDLLNREYALIGDGPHDKERMES